MNRFARIAGVGRYVPARRITNAEIEEMLGEPVDQWLLEHTGIAARHVMAPDQVTSDLAVAAARHALEQAGLTPQDVDLLILATDTPDYISPGTSSAVQAKLGAVNAATFDINNACAAFVYGLDIAARYIATDPAYDVILLIGAYGMTRYLDWSDKRTCTLFADGAGAVVLVPGDRQGFLGGYLYADGSYWDHMGIYGGGTLARYDCPPTLRIRKRYPPDVNLEMWPRLVRGLMEKIGHEVADIDFILFTQINQPVIRAVMSDLGLPLERTHWIMDKWGYTGSACMPMALSDAIERGTGPAAGDLVVFCGSGAGHAMGAVAFRW